MRAHVRLVGLSIICVLLASCAGTPASAKTTAAAATSTASAHPAVPNVYYATYAAGSGALVALNAADGAVRWQYAGHDVGAPFSIGNLVYTESANGLNNDATLTALDSASGTVVWSATAGSYSTAAPIANGVIYVTVGGVLECRNALTGKLRWQRQASFGKRTVTSSTVYSTSTSVTQVGAPVASSITAIAIADGTVQWTFSREHEGFTEPVSSDGIVFIHSRTSGAPAPDSGRLYALNAASGAVLWNVDAPATATRLVVSGGTLYMGGSANGIVAYRTTDGAQLWQNADPSFGSFVAAGSTVYIATFHHNVVALDATTGAQHWTVAADDDVSSPIIANGMLYVTVGSEIDNVVAINAATGTITWKQKLEATPGPMILAGGTLYTYTYEPDGGASPVLYAFDASNGAVRWLHTTGQNVAPGGLSVSGV